MPKMKSNSGAAKRFKARANDIKCKHSHTSHILTKKSSKRKRHLRGLDSIDSADVALVKRMLPNI